PPAPPPAPPVPRRRTKSASAVLSREQLLEPAPLVRAEWGRRLLRYAAGSAEGKRGAKHPQRQHRERPEPQEKGLGLDRRPQQDEVAVAAHHELQHLAVAVAGAEALADQHAQVVGEIGVGVVDRLVLAHQAAQLAAESAGTRLQRGIGEALAGLD